MRIFLSAALLGFTVLPMAAIAQAPAPVALPAALPAHYSVETTEIGALLDDPAAKAILDKHLPGFSSQGQIDMARSMTLKGVQQYAADQLTDKALTNIQLDLNKLPAKK
jgi:hypothetical protein